MSDQNLQHKHDHGQLKKVLQMFAQLRAPNGCPWMKEQDHHSLSKYTIEEAFELSEALDANKINEIKKELGDLLLQVILHSQIASENGHFNFFDVLDALIQKTEFRHPHVFANQQNLDTQTVIENWETLKAQESTTPEAHALNIPQHLPALQRSAKIGEKCERIKFDWENPDQVWAKLNEEILELQHARTAKEQEHEMGDILFTVAQLARHLKIDPEQALRIANNRFTARYNSMFEVSKLTPEQFKILSDQEKQNLWDQAKQIEKQNK